MLPKEYRDLHTYENPWTASTGAKAIERPIINDQAGILSYLWDKHRLALRTTHTGFFVSRTHTCEGHLVPPVTIGIVGTHATRPLKVRLDRSPERLKTRGFASPEIGEFTDLDELASVIKFLLSL